MKIDRLSVRGVRNLAQVELRPTTRFNVFAGDNGQGKTNLLETIYVVAALRSFRTAHLAELVGFGSEAATISATVTRLGMSRQYECQLTKVSKRVRLDGKAPRPLSRYFGEFNVVLFAPEDLGLARGAPSERRRFLDRAVFGRRADYLELMQAYGKVLKSRNLVLRELGGHGARRPTRDPGRGHDDGMLDVYDLQLAPLAAQIVAARLELLHEITAELAAAFVAITHSGLPAGVRYVVGGESPSAAGDGGPVRPPTADDILGRLTADRRRDVARGSTSFGPHRDDLQFLFDGRDAGSFASQGQLRALILAWKTAELDLVAARTGDRPILLLDDVSSELDETRNAYLFAHLVQRAGQCFITTTASRHVQITAERTDYRVDRGAIALVPSPS